uniref:Uncharacterized protein n=1 Tax=Ciona savignyi TaxID=51511 RepID=H2Y5H9_CIOSA
MPQRLPDTMMLSAQAGRLAQRELWPQAIQVAASSQMARMNVSGTGIPPMFFPTHPAMEGYPASLHQLLPTSQSMPMQHAQPGGRDNTQSPSTSKK